MAGATRGRALTAEPRTDCGVGSGGCFGCGPSMDTGALIPSVDEACTVWPGAVPDSVAPQSGLSGCDHARVHEAFPGRSCVRALWWRRDPRPGVPARPVCG